MDTKGAAVSGALIWMAYGRWILIGLAAVLLLALFGFLISKGGVALRDYIRARRAADATGGSG